MADLQRIPGLWLKEGKNGSKFMSGKTDTAIPPGTGLLIFKNDRKDSSNSPDY